LNCNNWIERLEEIASLLLIDHKGGTVSGLSRKEAARLIMAIAKEMKGNA